MFTAVLNLLWRLFRFILHLLKIALILGLLLTILQYSTLPLGLQWNAVARLARDHQFDYLGWEATAITAKLGQTLYGVHPFMAEADRVQVVHDYVALLGQVQSLEGQIARLFTDPDVSDPQAASADLRLERDRLTAELRSKQPLAESILEGQVAAALVEQGFGLAGQLIPPIAVRFTQMPNLLIVSPRDTIRFDIGINLFPLTVDQRDALEDEIDSEQNVSSLIVPLGGMALYPAMVAESTHIPYLVEVSAHEWLHHYLFMFPLGFNYDFAGEAHIINETTAAIFGQEIGPLVLARYYPDLLPPPPPAAPETPPRPAPPADPPDFDFGAAMHETRVTVDQLLAEGKIEQAEAYMEERRALFVEHGYQIRKLNQAYFAFYGGYQSEELGEGGQDPIGPAVRDIRAASSSLYDWIVTMRGITTREQLLSVRDGLQQASD